MFNKILVPLDGSQLSECSLEYVKDIAKGFSAASVILLRVVEPLGAQTVSALVQAGGDYLARAEQDNENEARLYLDSVSRRLSGEGLKNETAVVDGYAADEIMQYARENKIDVIVISTHGKSGPSRWLFGSVAERVARHSNIPVLLISPPGCRVPPTG